MENTVNSLGIFSDESRFNVITLVELVNDMKSLKLTS